MKVVKKTCEIHNLEYDAKIIPFLNLYSNCPKCEEDRKNIEKLEKERIEKRNKELEKKHFDDYIVFNSNIPDRYIDFNVFDSYENFSKNNKFLKEPLQNNIFIIGDTGTGKTLFLSKVLINNVERYPIYLNGNDLMLIQDNDFKISKILEKIDKKGIIAIDEVQMLILNERYLLMDAIIDKAYNQNSKIILCGNITRDGLKVLSNKQWKRISSRFKQGGVNILDFGDKDLR
ncbi:TPA: AAA family ATPase [Campylobacter jejuni]|nr:AAA family ATPase [Campylobacter jejuni]